MFKKILSSGGKERSEENLIKQFYRNISCIVSSDDVIQEVHSVQAAAFSQVLEDLIIGKEQECEQDVESEDFSDEEVDDDDELYIPFEPLYKNGCSEYNLILDLDGTLVHTLPHDVGSVFGEADFEDETLDFYTFKRPGVDKFLKYCFSHFASVSIWTAGTQDYARYVVDHITPKGKQFLYILSRDNCSYHPFKSNTLVKDLHGIILAAFLSIYLYVAPFCFPLISTQTFGILTTEKSLTLPPKTRS
jgi:TFIIF-interacting CTD phosphatase-like protein